MLLNIRWLHVIGFYAILPVFADADSTKRFEGRREGFQDVNDLKQIDKILHNESRYDHRIAPVDYMNDTNVKVYLRILNLWDVSEQSMDCKIDFYMELYWDDDRITFKSNSAFVQLPASQTRYFWVPWIFFPNSKRTLFHKVATPNNFIEVTTAGQIYYHLRISAKFSCLMKLHKYPFDSHRCFFQIASSAQSVRLQWESSQAVEMSTYMELPQFELRNSTTTSCDQGYVSDKTTDCLQVNFFLQRRLSFHLINTYFPSFLIVVISWGSFWMHADAVPGRVSLGITTLLTISSKTSAVLSLTAAVSYVKAIDIWMIMCMALVFLALCEFVAANYKNRHKKTTIEETYVDGVTKEKKRFIRRKLTKLNKWSLDRISRIVFPVTFGIFNVAYWAYYWY